MPFPNIGAPELIVILIIALVVLGPGKLPDVAASLGKSLREFRKAASDVSDAARTDVPPTPSVSPGQPAVSTPSAPVAPNTLSGSADPNTLHPSDPKSDQHTA
jgi:sec-independent protein translocase protein TatA